MSLYPMEFDDRLLGNDEEDTRPMEAIDGAEFPDWKVIRWHGQEWPYWVEETPDGLFTVQDFVYVKRGHRLDDVMRAFIDARAAVADLPSTADIQNVWMNAFTEWTRHDYHEDYKQKMKGIEAEYTLRW